METIESVEGLRGRMSPLEMDAEEFRALGYEMVDRLAGFLARQPQLPVTTGESPRQIRDLLGNDPLPSEGAEAGPLLDETARLLFEHSLFNGHPRFWGFITSSAAPIGALADMLAATVNPNVGGWILSPVASEIEAQTVRWIAEMLGYPTGCGGLLVSGGNMANFIGFIAARKAKAPWNVRSAGMAGEASRPLRAYVSRETHTWVQKAADLFGLGTDSIRWIPSDTSLRMDTAALRAAIKDDLDAGDLPFLVVGTAGSVSTGAIDPLPELAAICREFDLWFHVDGAYGGFAAALPESSADLKGLSLADSVAIDPHKWLYAPLEAGCALVRDSRALHDAFDYHPPYYFQAVDEADAPIHYHEYGPQNSRGFRALKVWLALRQVGLEGYRRMISDDIRLAEELYRLVDAHPDLEAVTQGLSITTFRYAPPDLRDGSQEAEESLNRLNTELLARLQSGGEAFITNAVIEGKFVLRACIVNFRTSLEDIEALPTLVARLGAEVGAEMRPAT